MNRQQQFLNFGNDMLPVLVKAVKDKEAGPYAVRKFLRLARNQIKLENMSCQTRRAAAVGLTFNRRERLTINRYYDLESRARKSHKSALDSLQTFLEQPKEHWLDKAISDFEVGERYKRNQIKMRKKLPAFLCERIGRASNPVALVA